MGFWSTGGGPATPAEGEGVDSFTSWCGWPCTIMRVRAEHPVLLDFPKDASDRHNIVARNTELQQEVCSDTLCFSLLCTDGTLHRIGREFLRTAQGVRIVLLPGMNTEAYSHLEIHMFGNELTCVSQGLNALIFGPFKLRSQLIEH